MAEGMGWNVYHFYWNRHLRQSRLRPGRRSIRFRDGRQWCHVVSFDATFGVLTTRMREPQSIFESTRWPSPTDWPTSFETFNFWPQALGKQTNKHNTRQSTKRGCYCRWCCWNRICSVDGWEAWEGGEEEKSKTAKAWLALKWLFSCGGRLLCRSLSRPSPSST